MKFLKEKKGIILSFIIGVILASSLTVYATSYLASQVIYKDEKTVEQALNDLYGKSDNKSEIPNFDLEVLETNGTYIKVKIPNVIKEKAKSYVYMLNGNVLLATNDSQFVYDNLSLSTNYSISVIAIDKNGNSRKSSTNNIETIDKLLLYDNGNEYNYITGGWALSNLEKNGRSQKNNNNILLYYSASGYSLSGMNTVNNINISNFSKVYVEYEKSNALSTEYQMLACGSSYAYNSSFYSSNYSNGKYVDEFEFNNYNGKIYVYDWDAYDTISRVYVK